MGSAGGRSDDWAIADDVAEEAAMKDRQLDVCGVNLGLEAI